MACNHLGLRIFFYSVVTGAEYELIWTYKLNNIILDIRTFLFEKPLHSELLGKCLIPLNLGVHQNYI
jgi:hypothetical protein